MGFDIVQLFPDSNVAFSSVEWSLDPKLTGVCYPTSRSLMNFPEKSLHGLASGFSNMHTHHRKALHRRNQRDKLEIS